MERQMELLKEFLETRTRKVFDYEDYSLFEIDR